MAKQLRPSKLKGQFGPTPHFTNNKTENQWLRSSLPKVECWSWNSNTLATCRGELTHLKRPWSGKDWRPEEKGTTEDEMAGWHHRHNGHGFGWTPGVGDGQGGLACCDSWGCKESVMTEQLNWTELSKVTQLVLEEPDFGSWFTGIF